MKKSEQPLSGVRILITRAIIDGASPDRFALLLRERGATLINIPVLEIREPDEQPELDAGLSRLSEYDWIIFASQNAVRFTLRRAEKLGISADDWQHSKIAAIGTATAERLREAGLDVQFSPSKFVAENLVEEFPGYPDKVAGLKVFWPRTNIGRDIIADKLQAAGAVVDTALSYVTDLPKNAEVLAQDLVKKLQAEEIDIITLASAQSAKNLLTLLKMGLQVDNIEPAVALKRVKIAAIGPVTAKSALQCFGRVDISASEYTLSGLTEALLASLK